jgi:hypothetical protein
MVLVVDAGVGVAVVGRCVCACAEVSASAKSAPVAKILFNGLSPPAKKFDECRFGFPLEDRD